MSLTYGKIDSLMGKFFIPIVYRLGHTIGNRILARILLLLGGLNPLLSATIMSNSLVVRIIVLVFYLGWSLMLFFKFVQPFERIVDNGGLNDDTLPIGLLLKIRAIAIERIGLTVWTILAVLIMSLSPSGGPVYALVGLTGIFFMGAMYATTTIQPKQKSKALAKVKGLFARLPKLVPIPVSGL